MGKLKFFYCLIKFPYPIKVCIDPSLPSTFEMSQAATPAKKASKPRKPASHPPFANMVSLAIEDLGAKRGSSRIAIKKHLLAVFGLEDNLANNKRINLALKRGVESGNLTTNRYHAGHFKNVKAEGKAAKADKSSKATPKKVATMKTGKVPMKKVAKAPTKTKTPTKKAAKNVAKKTPTKKAAKPKLAAKKPAVKKTPKKVAKKTGLKATTKK